MEINRLYNLCDNENIDINNYKMNKRKARIIKSDTTSIFIDYSKIHSTIEEKCLLAEELGHYYHDCYYSFNSSQIDIDKAEYRANKWKCLVCITKQALLNCFKNGLTNKYEIAEELEVEPDMVQFAYNYYFINH